MKPRPATRAFATVALLLVVVLVSVWIRWPGFTRGGFANHDVAGALYSAMLLADGGLPYVDSVELKAPGSFYLAWLLADGGLAIDRFQIAANAWALVSLTTVAAIAWRLFGGWSAVVAAGLYGMHDAVLDTMDANYVTWAQLPALLAVGAAFEASRADPPRRRAWGLWVLAGSLAVAAALIKRPAVFSLAFVGLVALWPVGVTGYQVSWRMRALRVLAIGLGGAVAVLPIALHYAWAGELAALLEGFVGNRWGWRYVGAGAPLRGWEVVREGAAATLYFLALPLALAGFAARPPRTAVGPVRPRTVAAMVLLWFALALAAAAIGGRFFKGYFLAVLPPLCVLAAAPWGLLGRALAMRTWVRVLLALPLLVLVARQGLLVAGERSNRMRVHDAGGRRIAAHVRQHTREGDRIWVWGWHLWDVYVFAERLAGTRFYKTLDLTTVPSAATWRRPAGRLRFADGPAARALLAELEHNRPAYIVLGSAVPAAEFVALQRFLRRHYVRDRRIRLNRVQFWQRRDG